MVFLSSRWCLMIVPYFISILQASSKNVVEVGILLIKKSLSLSLSLSLTVSRVSCSILMILLVCYEERRRAQRKRLCNEMEQRLRLMLGRFVLKLLSSRTRGGGGRAGGRRHQWKHNNNNMTKTNDQKRMRGRPTHETGITNFQMRRIGSLLFLSLNEIPKIRRRRRRRKVGRSWWKRKGERGLNGHLKWETIRFVLHCETRAKTTKAHTTTKTAHSRFNAVQCVVDSYPLEIAQQHGNALQDMKRKRRAPIFLFPQSAYLHEKRGNIN